MNDIEQLYQNLFPNGIREAWNNEVKKEIKELIESSFKSSEILGYNLIDKARNHSELVVSYFFDDLRVTVSYIFWRITASMILFFGGIITCLIVWRFLERF